MTRREKADPLKRLTSAKKIVDASFLASYASSHKLYNNFSPSSPQGPTLYKDSIATFNTWSAFCAQLQHNTLFPIIINNLGPSLAIEKSTRVRSFINSLDLMARGQTKYENYREWMGLERDWK